MKTGTQAVWVGIEFQPDLQKPRKPVRLGVLALKNSDYILLGRQPIITNKPPEFEDAGVLSLELAVNWIDSMWKDILESGGKENALTRLNERWRWNLYVRKIKGASVHGDLVTTAKQMYQRFVGEPFDLPARRRIRRRQRPIVPASALPQAWLISEIMKRTARLVA